jgi:uncharacterized protein involved in exopolysaccharide biosynthesis
LRLLWEARKFLGKMVLGGLLLGTLISFLLRPQYKSTVQLMPPENNNAGAAMLTALASSATGSLTGSSEGGGMVGGLASELLGGNSTGALFAGILRSRTVHDRLIQKFDLKKVYGLRLDEDTRTKLNNNTEVSEDRKSGIITVSVIDRDRERARGMAQAYVEELGKLVAELSTSAAHRERVFLEERIKAVKLDLDDASRKFSQFSSENKTIDLKEQGRAMVEAAAALQGQLIVAQSQLSELQQIYTANNVRVRALRARVNELRSKLNDLGGVAEDSQKAPFAKEEGTDSDSLYPSIRKLPLLGVTYTDLLRRAKIQEAVYEGLNKQYELAKVQEAKEIPSVKVLDIASVPERKVFPPRALIMFCFMALAFAVGSGWLFAEARWQRVEEQAAGKIFAREVFRTVNAKMPWASPNGSRVQAMTHDVWTKIVQRRHTGSPD